MDKYDVFISCKSEDYKFAEGIYDFLNAHGINTFLASVELRRLGESEYRRAISKALRDACHLIVFASNPEYIESTWVEYEWDMFVNAKLKGKKSGNIITILKGVKTDDIPMDLWKYESFQFEDYRNGIIRYVETPESIARSREKKKQEDEALRKKKEEEAKSARTREIKMRLTNTAEAYKKAVVALQVDIDKINGLLEELDINSRMCPICNTNNHIEANVCNTCGWPISPLEGLPELEYLNGNTDNIQRTFSAIYKEYIDLKDHSKTSVNKDGIITKLEDTIRLLKDEILSLKKDHDIPTQPEPVSQKTDGRYSVWVSFCPSKAEKIIAEYIPDLRNLQIAMYKKQPFRITTFPTESEATTLKTRLEQMGATVELRERDAHDSEEGKFDIFISYSQNDRDLAVALYRRLKAEGISVWNLGFADFAREIKDGIGHARYFVPILSKNIENDSASPLFHRQEWHEAVHESSCRSYPFIIPLVEKGFSYQKATIPKCFRQSKSIRYSDSRLDMEEVVKQIINIINQN